MRSKIRWSSKRLITNKKVKEMTNENLKVEDFHEFNSNPTDMLNQGLMRTQSAYTTSMQVLKPRDLNLVEKKCLGEAAIAGEEFIYQWPVKKKQTDGTYKNEQLIGLSVGAALAIARNMGNNAIDVQVEERSDCYIFYGAYIDLETGFNLRRAFRQRKEQNIGEKYKKDGRAEDITFQIGQSKAIRNVALNAAPSWLTKKIQDAALNSFAKKVEENPTKYKTMCLTLAKKLFVPIERIEVKYGKEAGWDVRKIISLLTELRTIEDGYDDVENVFPTDEKLDDKKQPEAQLQDKEKVPEVESVQIEGEKIEKIEMKTEDWENPSMVTKVIKQIASIGDLRKFKKEKKSKLEAFGGKDRDNILKALTEKEQEFIK